MTFREVLRKILSRTREALDNRKAEGSLKWIDNILYYINGKTRVVIEEHFTPKGKTTEELIEKTVIYENAHGSSDTNVKNNGGKAS
ncbi:MAG: hypothetical protein J6C92_07050 [Bacteroidaceae bacterium]|nr:hypothetical protein [Bacteroidaceae bacterium]